MAIEMYEVSRQMAIDSIKKLNPGISGLELKKELFKRFYKNDFTEQKMQEILLSFNS